MWQENLELTGKQKLVYEASKKIHLGEQMIREGKIELNNLIPDAKTVANKMLRSPGLFRKNNQSDEQLIERVLGLIDKEPKVRVTTNYVQMKLNISKNHAGRLKDKMKKARMITEKGSPGGGTSVWMRRTETKSLPENFIRAKENADKVLAFLKANAWVTTHKLVDGLKLTWYPAKRTLEYLVSKGLAKIVTKAGNPNHKDSSSFNRVFDYWEAV